MVLFGSMCLVFFVVTAVFLLPQRFIIETVSVPVVLVLLLSIIGPLLRCLGRHERSRVALGESCSFNLGAQILHPGMPDGFLNRTI